MNKIKNIQTKNKAFTVLELLIVIVIIGILATIVFISWRGLRDKATTSGISLELNGAAKTLSLYKAEYGSYPTSNDCSAGNKPAPPKVCLTFDNGVVYDYQPDASKNFLSYVVIAAKDGIVLKISDGGAPEVTTLPVAPAAPVAPPVIGTATVGNSTTYSWRP